MDDAFTKSYGVNISLQHCLQEPPHRYVQELKKLGVSWVRLELDWYASVSQEHTQAFVQELHKAKIAILGLLTGLVPGTIHNLFFKNKKYPAPFLARKRFEAHVKKQVEMFSQEITHWEIYNEPNHFRFWRQKPNAKQYLLLFKKIRKTILALQPEAKIISAGISGNDSKKLIGVQRNFFATIKKHIQQLVDGYAIHPYTIHSYLPLFFRSKTLIQKVIHRIEEFRRKHPEKPLWITEYGISSQFFLYSKKRIVRVYKGIQAYCKREGIPFCIWMLVHFKKKEYNPFNPETRFGLLDNNLVPTSVAKALYKK